MRTWVGHNDISRRDPVRDGHRTYKGFCGKLNNGNMTTDQRPILFYGYPAKLIADWCGVDIKTAERWKRGTQRPKRGHIRLFTMMRDRRILPEGWLYDAKRGELVYLAGNESWPLDTIRSLTYRIQELRAQLAASEARLADFVS